MSSIHASGEPLEVAPLKTAFTQGLSKSVVFKSLHFFVCLYKQIMRYELVSFPLSFQDPALRKQIFRTDARSIHHHNLAELRN